MATLRQVANETHNKYGIRSFPAILWRPENILIVIKMKNHKMIIITAAGKSIFNPKNTGDQIRFKNNWKIKTLMALLLAFETSTLVQINPIDKPIIIYRIDQTGPNNQLGGWKKGLFNVVYHPVIAELVENPDKNPNDKVKKIQREIFKLSDMLNLLIMLGIFVFWFSN